MSENNSGLEVYVLIEVGLGVASEVALELSNYPGVLFWDLTDDVYDIIAIVRLRDSSHLETLSVAIQAITGVTKVDMTTVTRSTRDHALTRDHSWYP